MHRMIEEQDIAALLVKEMAGTLSDQERAELEKWLSASAENRESYAWLQQMQPAKALKQYQQINTEEGWKKYRRKYKPAASRSLVRWASVAAAVVLVAGLGLWLNMQQKNGPETWTALSPGTSRAILVLEDGSYRNLAELKEDQLLQEGVAVSNDGKMLSYRPPVSPNEKAPETAYNELRIPRGGEFQLQLADGTHVWLNSETVLRYPVHFNDSLREIYLQGEAFFEVAKDKAHPFIVHTQNKVKVQVLGTSFNVKAYEDEEQVQVVLEEGAVRMKAADQSVILKPGDKASYTSADQRLTTQTVDTRVYTEWRNGQFIFIRKRVEDIFKDLARWYNIEVFYRQEAAKDILFSGSVKRYDTIETLLEAIEMAGGIRFEIKGNALFVDMAES